MYRYSDSGAEPVIGMDEGVEDPNELNLSSSMSMQTSQSGSKAVLAALRALQDKIRRLDSEKNTSIDECNQLKAQIKSMEIDFEHLKQRESLINTQAMLEAKSSYDSLKAEKAIQEADYFKMQDAVKEATTNFNRVKLQLESTESERSALTLRCNKLEVQCTEQDEILQAAHNKEREVAEWIVADSQRRDNDMEMISKRVRSLQNDLASVRDENAACAEKIAESEKLIGQLLSVNESLVKQIAGTNALTSRRPFMAAIHINRPITGKAKPGPKTGMQKTVIGKLKSKSMTDASTKTPKSTTGKGTTKKASKKGGWPSHDDIKTAVRTADSDLLHTLHTSYSNIAKKIKKSGPSSPSPSKRAKSPTPSSKKSPKTRLRKYSDHLGESGMTISIDDSAPASAASSPEKVSINLKMPSPKKSTMESILRPSFTRSDMNANTGGEREWTGSGRSPFTVIINTLQDELSDLQEEYNQKVREAKSDGSSDPNAVAIQLMSIMSKMQRKEDQLRGLKSQ